MATTTYTEKVRMRLHRLLNQHLSEALYRETMPVSIEAWKVGGEPVPFAQAKNAVYTEFHIGDSWGAAWDTWWFHVTGHVPESWDRPKTRPELVVDLGRIGLGPGFQAEGLVYNTDGKVIKAVEPYNAWVPAPTAGESVEFYIEAAANPEITPGEPYLPTELGNEGVKDGPELYRLKRLDLGLLDLEVWNLVQELKVLDSLSQELDPNRTRCVEIITAIENALNAIDTMDVAGSAPEARCRLKEVLSAKAEDGHVVYATGHAHIDTAWLWPLRETKRKVARTFSNVVELCEECPDFTFAASSAQQYQWLEQNYPDVFANVSKKVKEGSFVPVGGMWVECDANLPGGESLARQFLQGTKFFREHLGVNSSIAWLPDSFGYSGAFPQIAKLAGCDYFLTQKISWNDTNNFPHHSFMWQGIDGTEIFTHFPPSDKYNSDAMPGDVALSEKQYSEKGKGRSSLLLFGWGDGGGGPTREMVAATRIQSDLQGSPKVRVTNPVKFFEKAKSELQDPARWVGELYLELHRGTSTSETNTKQGNRRCESLLREAELWSTIATVHKGAEYPYDELQDIWQKVLLYQFHDILPGSAIAWVYAEVERSYKDLEKRLNAIIEKALGILTGHGNKRLTANAGPFEQLGVSAMSISLSTAHSNVEVVEGENKTVTLSDMNVSFTIDRFGHIISAIDKRSGRETIDPRMPGNVLELFVDAPAQWDAWDVDRTYEHMQLPEAKVKAFQLENGQVTVEGEIGKSTYIQHIGMDSDTSTLRISTHVDWNESDRLLKQSFPLDVYATQETSEIQYGHLSRPVIKNTSWDEAMFERSNQRWVHVAEGGFGVTLANRTNYGHDAQQITMSNGRPGTRIRLSLLRATHFPVPRADVGAHDFEMSFGFGGIDQAVQQGYRLNVPAVRFLGDHGVKPFLDISEGGVVVESVKLAEDRSGDVIVRLYESSGSRSHCTVRAEFDWECS